MNGKEKSDMMLWNTFLFVGRLFQAIVQALAVCAAAVVVCAFISVIVFGIYFISSNYLNGSLSVWQIYLSLCALTFIAMVACFYRMNKQ